MDGILKPLKTLEDWNEAMDVARFECNHSRAQIVTSKSKIRTSRKMAFLSAFPIVKSQQANCSEVKRIGSQTKKHESRSGPSKDLKIQIFVRSSVRETICLRLFASTSISSLKGLLQKKSGIPLEKQYLYTMKGLLLCDALSLVDHGIDCDTNLELRFVPGLMGGVKKRRPKGARNKSESTPREKEPTTRGSSAESARGQPESTSPLEKEPIARGSSAGNVVGQPESTSPLEEEPTARGSSAESVRGQPESTSPLEKEPIARGSSAESVRGQVETTPPEEEPTARGSSSEGVGGQPESTPREEEHATRGASSAESAAHSNSSPPASDNQQQPINLHFHKSHCTIGPSWGNTYNYGIPITADVQRNDKTDEAMTDRLLRMLQTKLKDYQIMIGLNNLFRSFSSQLARVVPGSVKLIVDVTCREGLDKIWAMYQSGELAERLTEILITDELTTEKSNITLKVTMMESDYVKGCECLGPIVGKLPELMADWTVDHVKYWLLDIGVKNHFVEQLFQEGFDGKALQSYTREQLIEDFNVDKIGSRLISNGKEDWLKSVNKHTGREDTKVDREETGQKMGQGLPFPTTKVTIRATDSSSKYETDTQRDESTRKTHSTHSESTEVVNPPSTAHPQTPTSTDKHTKPTTPHHGNFPVTKQVDAGKTFPTTKLVGHCKPASLDEADKKSQPSVRPKQRVVPLQLNKKQQLKSTDRESTTSMIISHQHPSANQGELALEKGQSAKVSSSIPVQSESETTQISKEVLMRRKQTAYASSLDLPKKQISQIHDESKAERSSQTAATISRIKSKPSESDKVASVVSCSKQMIPPHRTPRQQSRESHAEEPRLRKLLTGDERGELDESFYPVLIVNKPPESVLPSETELEQGSIAQRFGFIKAIKWVTVLDFYSKSLVNGLCKLYHDERMVTLQQPELFKDIESDVELRNSMDFPEKTLWVFTNGREDDPSFETPRMNLQDWNRRRSRDVEASISFFSKPSVIPEGRAVIMFLILSDDQIDILCDTFRKISSSFQGLQNITCIAENQETYAKFVSGVSKWFPEDEINQISVVGLNWEEINRIMMRMEGIHQTMDHELPYLGGRKCFLSDKQREEWNDITVIYKNECENTDMDESNPGYEKFAQRKELSFYHGEKVDWWNFAIGDREISKGCGHVLKRKGFSELLRKMSKPLNIRTFDDSKIVTVTLLHEPGAGGSTLARHVFWELHREHRCIVINRITNNTINQIVEVRRYGYENQDAEEILPVCVLVENLDDMELVDLIAELEEVSKGINVGHGTVCVLLHCKRSAMSFKITQDKSDLEVALYHKMDESEKERFQRKYTELEDKEKVLQTGEFKPDNLLAFMVMKEEFNPEYIKSVVSRILLDVKNDELLLIKYCAFLNSYRPDSVIPTSCCDSMMGPKSLLMRAGGISHHISLPRRRPWEKLVSPSFNIMVLRLDSGIKIFHKNIAEEVLRQIMQKNGNQSLFDVTAEFLNSELLKSKSYSRQNLVRTTHDLLIRRTKLPNEAKTDFSDLIEAAISSEGSEAAIEILKLGFKILDDAFVAQQIARLYLKESEFDKARTYADKALKLDSKNAYFWDTKGRILKKDLTDFSKRFLDEKQVMEEGVCRDFTSKSFEAMEIFRKSYEVSKEKMQTEYTGLYAEVDVAFRLLKVIYKCVEPLRTHGGKTQHLKHALSPQLESTFSKLKTEIDFVLDLMDDVTTYYKDGSHAQVAKKTLDETKEYLRTYTGLYEKYFGETPSGYYGYPTPTNVLEERRIKVKQLKCAQFRDIFDLARAKNAKVLQQSLQLLEQNSSDYSFFDLKTQILIHLALSSMGKPVMKADDVYQKFVRPLFKERDRRGNFYPPFFMMMFLWPIEGVVSARKDKYNLSHYSTELIRRGDDDDGQERKRHAKYNMKPRTYFFLGRGTDLRVFAHISELPPAAQNKLDKHDRDGTFWHSDFVKHRLLHLKGILVSSKCLVYRSPEGEDIQIKLAVPYKKRTPSQEKVEFYLGFSWVGPVAYDVTANNKKHEDTFLRFHEAYPKHILPDVTSKSLRSADSLGISKLARKRQELHLELQLLEQMGYKTEESIKKRDDIRRKLTKMTAELNKAIEKLEDSFYEDNSL